MAVKETYRTVELSDELVSRVERRLPRTEFDAADEYIAFVVEEVLYRVETEDDDLEPRPRGYWKNTIYSMSRDSFNNSLITDRRVTVRENTITRRRRTSAQTLRGLAQKSAVPAENTAIIDSSVSFPIDSGVTIHQRDPDR